MTARERILVEDADVQEEFFARGWTDGLPVVPPTQGRVDAFLELIGADDPELLIGFIPARNRGVTLESAAINSVMAGCKPEYFPIVIAALEAMFDPAFNLHSVLTSSGGAALCTIVSGPLTAEIEMNARNNLLGAGNRPNATIGRALRLVAINALAARTGESDASSFGHPGKYTFCFAEDPPSAPWQPLSVQLGYGADDTTVTVLPSEGPRQIAQQLTSSAELMLRTVASAIRSPAWFVAGKGGQGAVLLGPEHAGFCIRERWTQRQVREFLYLESRIAPEELLANGVQLERSAAHDMTPGEDGKLATILSPDHLVLTTGGCEGAGWSTWIPNWAPSIASIATTRRVRPAGEALPACGLEGCIVPWATTAS